MTDHETISDVREILSRGGRVDLWIVRGPQELLPRWQQWARHRVSSGAFRSCLMELLAEDRIAILFAEEGRPAWLRLRHAARLLHRAGVLESPSLCDLIRHAEAHVPFRVCLMPPYGALFGLVPPRSEARECQDCLTLLRSYLVPPAAPRGRGSRKRRRESRYHDIIVAALLEHHRYDQYGPSVLNTTPVRHIELARLLCEDNPNSVKSSISRWFKKHAKGFSNYREMCSDPRSLATWLRALEDPAWAPRTIVDPAHLAAPGDDQ